MDILLTQGRRKHFRIGQAIEFFSFQLYINQTTSFHDQQMQAAR